MSESPAACAGAAVRSFADAVVTGDIVHHDGTGVHAGGDFPPLARIGSPNAGAQTERRIVRELNCFVGGVNWLDCDYRAEGFLAHELHGMIHVRDHGRLEEVGAEIGASISASEYFCTTLRRFAQLLLDFF